MSMTLNCRASVRIVIKSRLDEIVLARARGKQVGDKELDSLITKISLHRRFLWRVSCLLQLFSVPYSLYIYLSLQHKLTFHISQTHSRFLLFVLLAFSLSLCCHSPSVSITLSHTSTFSLSLTSTSFDNFMLFGSPLSPSGLKDQMLEVAFGFSIRRRRSQGNAICISFYGWDKMCVIQFSCNPIYTGFLSI